MTASRPSVARTRTGRPALSGCTRRHSSRRAADVAVASASGRCAFAARRGAGRCGPAFSSSVSRACRWRSARALALFWGGAVAASSSPHKRAARPLARAAPKSGQHPMQRPFARRGHSGRRVHHLLT